MCGFYTSYHAGWSRLVATSRLRIAIDISVSHVRHALYAAPQLQDADFGLDELKLADSMLVKWGMQASILVHCEMQASLHFS